MLVHRTFDGLLAIGLAAIMVACSGAEGMSAIEPPCRQIDADEIATLFAHYDGWHEQPLAGGCEWRTTAAFPSIELWVSDSARLTSSGNTKGASFAYPENRHLHLRLNLGDEWLTSQDERALDELIERVSRISLEAMRGTSR